MSIKIDSNTENAYNTSTNYLENESNKYSDFVKNSYNTSINSSGGKTIIDMIDITSELTQVSKYSMRFLTEFINMIKTGYNFVQDTFFNITSTKYTIILIAIFVVLLISIFLFSKNKIKDILILIYFGIGFAILLGIKFVLKFLTMGVDQIKGIFKQLKKIWEKLYKDITNINSMKDFFYLIYNFCGPTVSISIKLFLLCCLILFAGVICIGIQLMFNANKFLFNSINGMSDTVEPIDTTKILKVTFGSALEESMERL